MGDKECAELGVSVPVELERLLWEMGRVCLYLLSV